MDVQKKQQPAPFRVKVVSHDTVEIYNPHGDLVFKATCDKALAVQDVRCVYCFQRNPGVTTSALELLRQYWEELDVWQVFDKPPLMLVEGSPS